MSITKTFDQIPAAHRRKREDPGSSARPDGRWLSTRGGSAVPRIPGVGSSIAAKIAGYGRTGTIKAVDDLRAKVPPGVLLEAGSYASRPSS